MNIPETSRNQTVAERPRHRLWRATRTLLLLALALFLISLAGIILSSAIDISAIDSLQGALDRLAFPLFLLRVALYGMVLYFWEPLTRRVARRNDWSEQELAAALSRRGHMALWLLGMELLISGSFLWRVWS